MSISFGIVVVIFLTFYVNAQDSAPTVEPLPTRPRNAPFWSVFPANLYCYDIVDLSEGPTWGGVTIGISNVEDLKEYMSTIGNYDSINQWADYISFARTGDLRDEAGIPSVVASCVDMTTQTVTALSVSTINPALYLEDLVAQYGTPDAVTWGFGSTFRTVFWFAEGIAASVNIFEQNEMLDYGQIDFIVYFPYQSKEDFEERWPYNRTNSENPTGGDRVYDPPPSEAQNPFNFDAMIAMITAEPSRTPTPTYAPLPTTVTLTPTP